MIQASPLQRLSRAVLAWIVVGIFAFPIYYWFTIAFRVEREIFELPPLIFDWTFSGKSFEEVFGISLGYTATSTQLTGGGNFYMMPRLLDSIIVAVGSTILTVAIATLASYALSRMRFAGQHHFVFWILSTRMMPPVAIAIPMFFIYKQFGLLDTHIGIILVHSLMNLPLAVLLLKSFFDDIPNGNRRGCINRRRITLADLSQNRCTHGHRRCCSDCRVVLYFQLDRVSVCAHPDANESENSAGGCLNLRDIHWHSMGQYGSSWEWALWCPPSFLY